MKLKNIGFFQQHIEKLVLGAAGLFLLVATVLFVLRDPFSIELPGIYEKVAPGEVEQVVADKADELAAKLEEPLREDLPKVPTISETFTQFLLDETLPYSRFAGIGSPPLASDDIGPPAGPDSPYFVPRPPLAEDVHVHASHAVLADPAQVNEPRHQDVVQLANVENKPHDFAYSSVSAVFNLDQWRRNLRADPPAGKGRKLDQVLATNRVGIAGVYLQRQELDPSTGQWTNTTIVRPLPTRVGFVAGDAVDWQGSQANAAMQWIRDNQDPISQPAFVPLAKGQWIPPHLAPPTLGPEQTRELHDVNEDIQQQQQRIDRYEEMERTRPSDQISSRLDRARDEMRRLEIERRKILGLSVDDRELEQLDQQRNRSRQDRNDPRRNDPRRNNPRRDNNRNLPPDMLPDMYEEPTQQQFQRGLPESMGGSGDRSSRPITRLAQNNGDGFRTLPPDMPRRDDQRDRQTPSELPPWLRGQRGGFNGQQGAMAEEQADEMVRVWAHDVTVEYGKTYRYRIIVSVLNPLFQQERGVPEEQQQEYYDKIAIGPDEQVLAKAEWTEPVQIDAEYYFFLVGGSTGNDQAEIEIWRIYDGEWRHETFRFRPGDPIAGTMTIEQSTGPTELELASGALFVDLMAVNAGNFGGRDTRMLYFDESRGQMADRTIEQDSDHPDRLRLQNEIMLEGMDLMQARLNGEPAGAKREAW